MKALFSHLVRRIKASHHSASEKGQGIVEYVIILSLVGMATVLIVNVMEPVIANVFADFVEKSAVAPPELIGYTRVPPTPTATPEPIVDLTIAQTGQGDGEPGGRRSPV